MLQLCEKWGLLELNEWSILLRLALAVICSGVLGLERTRKRRPAGLRTYMLVCIGAAVSMMTAQFMSQNFGGDPGRFPAQVISGIGFLGAGTIMVTRYYRIKGLTTAAGLWAAACMGLAIGIGFYFGAIVICLALIFVMAFADKFENRYTQKLHKLHLYIIFSSVTSLRPFIKALRAQNIELSDVETTKSENKEGIGLFCLLKFPDNLDRKEALILVEAYEGVLFVEEIDS